MPEDTKAMLEKLLERQERLEQKLETLIQQQHTILANQTTLYGRLLVTRLNFLELYHGKSPSVTKNEQQEINEHRHPELVTSSHHKKQIH